ncbi:MAG: histidinol dehydrogenase [Bacteroidota bacterium]
MKVYQNLSVSDWHDLLKRPAKDVGDIEEKVLPILQAVKTGGDAALKRYTAMFDGVEIDRLAVTMKEINAASYLVEESLKKAIAKAKANIEKFHAAQREPVKTMETMPGIRCWRRSIAIEKVGLYVPGGTAPLFSTVLMLAVPAMVAGCAEVIICTPPQNDGSVHPAILYTADLCGVSKIYKVGGAQAIAAMAYGTETIPKVHKLYGPGNAFVAVAKQLVNREGVAIDLFAGPSEVLVIADESADALAVATDLLAQAEHGADSHCLLVTTSETLLGKVQEAVLTLVAKSPRRSILELSITNFSLILIKDLGEAMKFSDDYAPEHLIICTANAGMLAGQVKNAGSVFVGHLTPVSLGDYASGTNHTLPTNGTAIAFSGVSLDSFIKKVTFQEADLHGLSTIGPVVQVLAEAEGLQAHADAVSVRLNKT